MECTIVSTSDIQEATDTEWLIAELRNSLSVTVEHVTRVAAIIKRLEELGVEIDIRLSSLPYLRRIAYGAISPHLFVSTQGNGCLLRKASSLPLPDQEMISRNEPLEVWGLGGVGDFRMVPPFQMTRQEVEQVIGAGKIRSAAEQVGYLRRKQPEPPLDGGVSISLSKKRRGIIVSGPCFISAAEMDQYLRRIEPKKRTNGTSQP